MILHDIRIDGDTVRAMYEDDEGRRVYAACRIEEDEDGRPGRAMLVRVTGGGLVPLSVRDQIEQHALDAWRGPLPSVSAMGRRR